MASYLVFYSELVGHINHPRRLGLAHISRSRGEYWTRVVEVLNCSITQIKRKQRLREVNLFVCLFVRSFTHSFKGTQKWETVATS